MGVCVIHFFPIFSICPSKMEAQNLSLVEMPMFLVKNHAFSKWPKKLCYGVPRCPLPISDLPTCLVGGNQKIGSTFFHFSEKNAIKWPKFWPKSLGTFFTFLKNANNYSGPGCDRQPLYWHTTWACVF